MSLSCRLATTANLVGTYAAGPDINNPGFQATITITATGTVTIDGEFVLADMIVLIKNQSNPVHNGIYVCTTEGDVAVQAVFTRLATFSYPGAINGYGPIVVRGGLINAITSWAVTSELIIEVGVSPIVIKSLSANSYISLPTAVTTATYTMINTDQFLVCNRAGTIAIALIPSPDSGRVIIIKDNSGAALVNNITITPAAGNIDGAANYVINTNYGSVTLIYNGTQWNVT